MDRGFYLARELGRSRILERVAHQTRPYALGLAAWREPGATRFSAAPPISGQVNLPVHASEGTSPPIGERVRAFCPRQALGEGTEGTSRCRFAGVAIGRGIRQNFGPAGYPSWVRAVLYEDSNQAAYWNDAPMAETERSPNNAERGTSASDGARVGRSSASGRKPTGAAGTAGERRGTSAEKRQLILETSIRVFAEKGYHDTRISDIAKRAEIAYGLVYHYFKNKEEILDTIFLERWGEFIAAVRAIAEGDRTVEDKLVAVAEVILSARQHDPEWVKILISEIQRSQRMLDRERLEIVAELFQLIARILRDGQERGELRAELDAEIASTIFIGGIDTILTSRVLEMIRTGDEGPPDEEVYFDHLSRTVVELFIRGMAAPDAFGAGD